MVSVYAWVVVALAGLGTLAGVFVLTRVIHTAWLRSLLRCLAAVWLMVPSKIQVVDSEYAPAFIVALFEGAFRADGNPGPALAALTIASLVVIALFLMLGVVRLVRNAAKRRATP